jgi:hypothetical protein
VNCSENAVSKHAIRIPPLRAGRRVRWTFEVSAEVGAENGARAKKTPKKGQRAKPTEKMTRTSASHREPPVVPESAQPSATTPALEATAAATTVSPAESVVPLVTPHVAQHPPAPVPRATHLRTIALAGVTLLVVAALAFPRHPSAPGTDDGAAGSQPKRREQPADLVALSLQPAALPAAPIAAPVAASATVAPSAVSAPSKKTLVPKPETNGIRESTQSGVPVAAVTTVADIPFQEDAAASRPRSETIAPPAPEFVSTRTGGTMPVTITGCLEVSVNQDEFRLTETEGVDAPRSRSWRMGFLKKRSAPVALVEAPDRLALQTHVGRRVAATGLLTSHDLKVSALRVVGPCN